MEESDLIEIMSNQCECTSCKAHRVFKAHVANMRSSGLYKAADFMIEMSNYLCEIELDLDVSKGIIDGTWPTADEWIARKRNDRVRTEAEE